MGTERQRLMSFAYRLLASRADAEDAVQDVFEFDYDEIARIIGKREAAARPWMLDGVHNCS